MCGLIFVPLALLDRVDRKKCKKRGPDAENLRLFPGIGYAGIHYTLFVTGENTPQPIETDNTVLLFNGEVYNYKDIDPSAASDGHAIVSAFREHGPRFAQHLDGEFSIVLVDLPSRRVVLATDPFGTKPFFYAVSPGVGICAASYPSAIPMPSKRVPPNTIMSFDLDTLQCTDVSRTRVFDLRQHKSTYDDWIAAFHRAVEKRSRGQHVYVGMSSGYDSGAICASLNRLGATYTTMTSHYGECKATIRARADRNKQKNTLSVRQSEKDVRGELAYLEEFAEDLSSNNINTMIGLGIMHVQAAELGLSVMLSGQGADEIVSDYGIDGFFRIGGFGGLFPDDLTEILPTQDPDADVPWKSFYNGVQRRYLLKEEFIGGAHGVETRYPFLDAEVVQEFLWLTPALKNACYKAPIQALLDGEGYPYEKGVKRGFTFKKEAPLCNKYRKKNRRDSLGVK